MILDDAIIELFDQGIYSPLQIEQMLDQRGKRWLNEALYERRRRLIREYARELAQKRTVLVTPRPSVTSASSASSSTPATIEPRETAQDVYGNLIWVMGKGYMPINHCTSADLRSAATYLRTQAAASLAKAGTYEKTANEMDRVGAKTVADLGYEVAA